jgi:hypothetical protein
LTTFPKPLDSSEASTMRAMLQRGSVRTWMLRLINSDGCRPWKQFEMYWLGARHPAFSISWRVHKTCGHWPEGRASHLKGHMLFMMRESVVMSLLYSSERAQAKNQRLYAADFTGQPIPSIGSLSEQSQPTREVL